MPFNMTFQHNKIKAILVYLELKTTRELVGKLEYKNKKYCFSYDKRYLEFKKALPIGPELPLTKLYFESEELFPSFVVFSDNKNCRLAPEIIAAFTG